jgi:hypothetical protein
MFCLKFAYHEELQEIFFNLLKSIPRSSRNRTYIRNLEGCCPNPLDDRPFLKNYMGDTGFEPVTFCL